MSMLTCMPYRFCQHICPSNICGINVFDLVHDPTATVILAIMMTNGPVYSA